MYTMYPQTLFESLRPIHEGSSPDTLGLGACWLDLGTTRNLRNGQANKSDNERFRVLGLWGLGFRDLGFGV